MRAVDIIIKKRDGKELSKGEINFFIQGFARDEIPDYQASAWAMAVMLKGMTMQETANLAMAMAKSGQILDLSGLAAFAVDKHSTGGVGDKTTLVVLPVVAASGLVCAKMSGRGLGFSGGTLDKLESIPGYRTNLSPSEFQSQLKKVGLVLTGHNNSLAPADAKLYALRDVTGSVESLPLIASSIMSKKIAGGARRLVLDVKVGRGAFMKTLEDARALAETMVEIARLAERQAVALLSDMNQPLGQAVGNALEVKEAIETLHGGGPDDFREHCMIVASHLLMLGGVADSEESARKLASEKIANGEAWERFCALVTAQGGDVTYVQDPERLPKAPLVETVDTPQGGYLKEIDARIVGEAAVLLGAGRAKKGDLIDHAVGILVHHNVGDEVEKGEPLFTIHANDRSHLDEARRNLLAAHAFSDSPVEPLPLFYGVVK